ncbi:hypothetical protein PROFUN_03173 [Planoprotostelium fungivorum]|uniref:Phospholipid/glycerol acyltransferase domain-containing protein n=1 Tax=Planoprotostelium fungivorum TaxID=1890364 RepID=A0A2P6NX00_9EUKA|nr:hypothetical protein PROFUN_03173 [Planoprotostelium fungivorum]
MSLSVRGAFRGKGVLLTGCTGFVGKALYEKILRDIPDVGRIFILIRGKADERFWTEIHGSPIMVTLQSRYQGRENALDSFVRSKVVPVRGDVQKADLGLSKSDYKLLCEQVNIVVHCAATVDFRERLDVATMQNVMGTLNIFELSRTFQRLDCFLHVSTAYVNSDRRGTHMETLPPLDCDAEEMVQLILHTNPDELEKATPSIIGNYPNTYTFTKALTEVILAKRKGDIPVAILRPTIVASSNAEPIPGWIDSVSAVAAAVLFGGLGIMHSLVGNTDVVADIVPVDMVVNGILLGVASQIGRRDLTIYHCGTSKLNPIKWLGVVRWASAYWRQHNVEKRIDPTPLRFRMYQSRAVHRGKFFVEKQIPANLYAQYAKWFGSEKQKKNSQMLLKANKNALSVSDAFVHFTTNEYMFDTSNLEERVRQLVPDEKNVFGVDFKLIDWERYMRFLCYGLQRFVLKEEVRPPTEVLKIDLVNEPRRLPGEKSFFKSLFDDANWAFSRKYHQSTGIDSLNTLRTTVETKAMVLKSTKVKEAINYIVRLENITSAEGEKRAEQIFDRMAHTMTLKIVRGLGYFLRKVFRRIYSGIHVEEKGIDRLRQVLGQGPILLVPSHRSYVDFLIISYIMYEYDLPLPHIAAGEDFLGIFFVNWVFRNSGAFFLRRSFKEDVLYSSIFSEYVQRLVADWSPIEFFIEGKRSRTGKSLHPKFGLLNICMEPFIQKKVPDLMIVPISITYEKALEAELYSNELQGEQKVKESFSGLLKARSILNTDFGRINIIPNEPISVKQFIEQNYDGKIDPFTDEVARKRVSTDIGYAVTKALNDGLVITSTAILATILLAYRKGISFDDIVVKVEWMRDDIVRRGSSVAFEGTSKELARDGLALLGNLVSKVRNVHIPSTFNQIGKQNRSALILDYYRNQLIHLYGKDGIFAAVFQVFNENGKLQKEKLLAEAETLTNILWLEFINNPDTPIKQELNEGLNNMIHRGLLSQDNQGNITVGPKSETRLHFVSQMVWPLVDAYWVGSISLLSLQPDLRVQRKIVVERMQWIAEKMFAENNMHHYESSSMETLQNCVDLLTRQGLTTCTPTVIGKKGKSPGTEVEVVELTARYKDTTSEGEGSKRLHEWVERVAMFRKPSNNYATIHGLRNAVVTDFPVLAKL